MTTDPRDALILGDTSDLSPSTREWLDSLGPVQNTPSDVLARHMRAANLQDAEEERERERRRSAALADREDLAALAWVRGDAAETVTVAERLRDWAALNEIEERNQERNDARIRKAEADARAERQAKRIAELETELAREQLAHTRASWRAADAIDGWQAARARAAEAEQSGYRADTYSSYPRYRSNYRG
jgi:hypothetical protein